MVESRWRKYPDEIPPLGVDVLVYTDCDMMVVAYLRELPELRNWNGEPQFFDNVEGDWVWNVRYWLPLPPIPEEMAKEKSIKIVRREEPDGHDN